MQPTAVVTGGSSGIGAAACRRLRAEGWHTIGLARRPSPDASASVLVDIARFDDVVDAFEDIPQVQLLVHAAAMIGPIAPLPETDPDGWRRTVEVNLLGTYNLFRVALAGTLAREHGIAIHLTTGAAANAKPYWSAYSATKAGAEHLVRSAACDIAGTNRGVCSLDPGVTETAMQQEMRSREFPDRDRFIRNYEERAYRTPEEVADAIWQLSQREPSAINGKTFRVGAL
jgi:NAD(P)-dependent dehydrogenase (short-subunit alcohol dehydrogenase family)